MVAEMKTLVIDWLANTHGWASGVAIRNTAHTTETVAVLWDGEFSYHTLLPWAVAPVFPKDKDGPMVIFGADTTQADATTWNKNGGYSFVPVREAWQLCDAIAPVQSPSFTADWSVKHSPFWAALKGPNNNARYNKCIPMAAVQIAAMGVYYAFTDRKDRALGLMDACPPTGDAAGHPAGSHSATHGLALDVSYYTLTRNNTQIGNDPVQIFTNGKLNSEFDIDRNKMFFAALNDFLPGTLIMVDDRIAAALGNPKYLQGDSIPAYNHDKHAHLMLAPAINGDARI